MKLSSFSNNTHCPWRLAGRVLALALVSGALACVAPTPTDGTALAADTFTSASTEGARQTEIEVLSDAYEDAKRDAIVANAKTAVGQARLDVLERQIPVQQKRSDDAARYQYKLLEQPYDILEMLVSSQSLDDFIRQSEYIDRISSANLREMSRLREMERQLEDERERLAAARAEAGGRLDEAKSALEAVQRERAERQSAAQASAASQAASKAGEASVGIDGAGEPQPEDYRIAATDDASAIADGADWFADEHEFVGQWAPRIDSYLAGTPMEGLGEAFAEASWRYCVDPRWSPAIANTESSKGLYCIRPHNAWGWGAADSDPYNLASEWDSWESAIDAHVRGLAEGYGYTISIDNARTYCPPNWQSWYNNTLGEMGKI